MQGFLTIVYGESVQARRKILWQELSTIAAHVQSSRWLV